MSDFLIIGGGIIGLLMARSLHQKGASVTLLEAADNFGQEASWAGGGIISPLYPWRYSDVVSQLAKTSQQSYPQLAAELLTETGIDIELTRSGILMLDPPELDLALAWVGLHQVRAQYLQAQEASAQQNHLGITAPALWLPDLMQVRNPRLLKALVVSLKKSGVTLISQQRVIKMNSKNARILDVETKNKKFTADKIIIAAGAWSAQLLKPLNKEFPIKPVKGQMLLFKTAKPLLEKMVLYDNRYLIPRKDGYILAGSTLEPCAGFDKIPTESAYQTLYAAAIELLPALESCDLIAQWSGLRPGSPESNPFIGRVEPYENLYINAGHYRNGLVLAPGAVAQLVTEILAPSSSFLINSL
jgi:glycine oxidase